MRWICGLLLAAAFVITPARAAEPWREASSTHFVIYSQDSAANLQRYAERLERFDKALRVVQQFGDPPLGASGRLTVFVVADTLAVQRLYGRLYSGVAGFYHGKAAGSIAVTSREQGTSGLDLNPQLVLLHEYTHHFMLRNFPAAYPAWYREGFAEFYGTTRFEPDGALSIGVPANHRVRELATVREFELARMLSDGDGRRRGPSMEEVYGFGWLLTHYLKFSEKRSGQLATYLAEINRGTPPIKAAATAFGDLHKLQAELRDYLSHRRIATARLAAAQLPIVPVSVRDLTPAEQAILPVAIRSRLGVTDKTADDVAIAARRAAAPFPNDPVVQLALAEAEFDDKRLDAADAAADRALAADSKAMRGLLYKAAVRLARARAAQGDAKRALIREARGFATRANRIDPDHPGPLMLFYESYVVAGDKPSANAVTGLIAAHLLAPEDDDLRLQLAGRLVADARAEEARRLLAPLAYDAHGDPRADAARTMLAKLSADQTAAAPATAPPSPH